MKNTHKTKQIQKPRGKQSKDQADKKEGSKTPAQPITNAEGDPLIENLSDFITSIKNTYTSKPIYTGGRVLINKTAIYATCNEKICIYRRDNPDNLKAEND